MDLHKNSRHRRRRKRQNKKISNSRVKNENPDPSLNNLEFGCTLLIGRSGSGKSYNVKQILKNIKNK